MRMSTAVTDIDQFRYWKHAEDMSVADLIARLRRQTEPTSEMLAGIAFHRAVELATPEAEYGILRARGHTFIIECNVVLPEMQARELPLSATYDVSGVEVDVRGRVDGITGLKVFDLKTMKRACDHESIERLKDTMQWRFYLDMATANEFQWDCFSIEPIAPNDANDGNVYRVWAHNTHNQWCYPGMKADMMAELREFVEFCRTHLPERFEESA